MKIIFIFQTHTKSEPPHTWHVTRHQTSDKAHSYLTTKIDIAQQFYKLPKILLADLQCQVQLPH